MTISNKDRLGNIDNAFNLLMTQLGKRRISEVFFYPNEGLVKSILQTTWKELSDQGWAEEHLVCEQTSYRLTGDGWAEGLWRIGAGKHQELLRQLGHLSAELKGYVKERQTDVTVEFERLVEKTALPNGWLFNVIESNLIEKFQRRRGISWKDRGILVTIPLNFGMELLDHTVDARAELEELRKRLDITRQELSEHKCSFCGAPIIAQEAGEKDRACT